MFSDGIRPGGDLTEADGVTEARLPQRSGRKVHKVEKISAASGKHWMIFYPSLRYLMNYYRQK